MIPQYRNQAKSVILTKLLNLTRNHKAYIVREFPLEMYEYLLLTDAHKHVNRGEYDLLCASYIDSKLYYCLRLLTNCYVRLSNKETGPNSIEI